MVDSRNNQDETPELERKVDAMMDPRHEAESGDAGEKGAKSELMGPPELPEIDIFKDRDVTLDAPVEDTEEPVNTTEPEPDEPPTKEDPADEVIASGPAVDDSKTEKIVDDIVSQESDQLLAADDAAVAKTFISDPPKHGGWLKAFLGGWWHHKWARYGTLLILFAAVMAAGTFPTSRYLMLNTAGVRVSASLTVLDQTNNLPLKNVAVSAQGTTVKTNEDGVAHLSQLKLGRTALTISRLGFAPVHQTIILGLGSNPLSDVSLQAVGAQFKFNLVDYLSGKPVTSAEVSSGDATAQTDDHGQAILTLDAGNLHDFQAVVTAAGYRPENVPVSINATAPIPVSLVNSRQVVYVSKQSGKYDVYKSYIDGQGKQVLLPASGMENDQMSLVEDPTAQKAALVSRRDNQQNQDGYNLQALTVINIADGSTLTLEHSESIQLVGWDGNKLVYVKIKAGTSAGNPQRYQLYSYDVATTTKLLLASANYFSDIVMIKGTIYYAASNNFAGGQSQFAKINDDNSGQQVLLSDDVFNILRNGYDKLYVSANPGPVWYGYQLGDDAVTKLGGQPNDADTSRYYLDAPDGKHALWTDVRDGQGVLLTYDANTKQDTTLVTKPGLTYPLQWLDNRTVMYRIETPQESADYVLSLNGGTPKKVADVTNTAGSGKWFYY